jgi:phosphoribosylformylglycinamidine synthase
VYVLGETDDELGASEYFTMLAEKTGEQAIGNTAPRVDAKKNLRTYQALEQAIQKGLVASAIGVGRGGLAAALAKTAIAGKLGIMSDLSKLPGSAKQPDSILFSESQGRILVSIRHEAHRAFAALFRGVPLTKIGEVTKKESLETKLGDTYLKFSLESLATAYRKPFKNW